MYAIAFDLVVKDTQDYHPKGVQQAYTDIGETLQNLVLLEHKEVYIPI